MKPTLAGAPSSLDSCADRPRVGGEHPGNDLDEGGIAGAILPEQGVNLAGVEVGRDVVEGLDPAEGLGDPVHVQQRGLGHVGGELLRV
jgi:hypothetical protein